MFFPSSKNWRSTQNYSIPFLKKKWLVLSVHKMETTWRLQQQTFISLAHVLYKLLLKMRSTFNEMQNHNIPFLVQVFH